MMRTAVLILVIGVAGCASASRPDAWLGLETAPGASSAGIAVVEAVQYTEKRTYYTPYCSDQKRSLNSTYCFDLKHTERSPVIEMTLSNDSSICYKEVKITYELSGPNSENPPVALGRVRYLKPGVLTKHKATWSYRALPPGPLSTVRIVHIEPGPESCDGEAL